MCIRDSLQGGRAINFAKIRKNKNIRNKNNKLCKKMCTLDDVIQVPGNKAVSYTHLSHEIYVLQHMKDFSSTTEL